VVGRINLDIENQHSILKLSTPSSKHVYFKSGKGRSNPRPQPTPSATSISEKSFTPHILDIDFAQNQILAAVWSILR
jgi:hypothetical protein